MAPQLAREDLDEPDISAIVTHTDIYSAMQQRLLTEPLFGDWSGPTPHEDGAPRSFVALTNVEVFHGTRLPPIVPDMLLSADVTLHPDIFEKKHRTYFVWEFGKTPDVVVEVVSNKEGGELGAKKQRYAVLHVPFYVVWDPGAFLGETALHAFVLTGDVYRPASAARFLSLGLQLVPWTGVYEDLEATWLRWATLDGTLLATGAERARAARAEADTARAEADTARTRAEQLAARLRALGIDPDAP